MKKVSFQTEKGKVMNRKLKTHKSILIFCSMVSIMSVIYILLSISIIVAVIFFVAQPDSINATVKTNDDAIKYFFFIV